MGEVEGVAIGTRGTLSFVVKEGFLRGRLEQEEESQIGKSANGQSVVSVGDLFLGW